MKKLMKNNKEYILDKISEALVKEELAIPLYTSHIEQTLFWSGFDEDKKKQILISLNLLTKESRAHVGGLKKIMAIYKKLK